MTPAKVRLAAAAMGKKGTVVGDLCEELGITRSTIYRRVPYRGASTGWEEGGWGLAACLVYRP